MTEKYINPKTPYIANTKFQSNDAVCVYILETESAENEKLSIGHIPLDFLYRNPFEISHYLSLFETKKYLENVTDSNYGEFGFSKLLGLYNHFLKDGKFQGLCSAHYNPRLQKIIIHPGSTRQLILEMFSNEPIEYIFFNTNGVTFPFSPDMEVIEPLQKLHSMGYSLGSLTPDHGSLIPHPKPNHELDNEYDEIHEVVVYNNKIKNIIYNNKIYKNFECDYIDSTCLAKTESESDIILKLNISKDKDEWDYYIQLLKMMLILCNNEEYSDDKISIVKNKKPLI